MTRYRGLYFTFLLLLILYPASGLASIRFGIFTTGSPESAIQMWAPLADYLAHELGTPCELVPKEDYMGMLEALAQKEVDFVEGGPRTSTGAVDRGLGTSLVRIGRIDQQNLHTVILASAQSGIHRLEDLRSRRFALVDELSTFGYLFPRIALHKAGIDNPETYFHQIFLMGSHGRAMEAVIDGVVDGAAVADLFYHALPPKQLAKLRIIHQSAPIAPDADDLVVRSHLDPLLQNRLKEALLRYHDQVPIETRKTVAIDRFLPADVGSQAYQDIRADLALGQTLPRITYAIPYQHTPAVITQQLDGGKRKAYWYFAIIFACGIGILSIIVTVFRAYLPLAVGGSILAIYIVMTGAFSAIQLLALTSAIDTFASHALSKIETLNTRIRSATTDSSTDTLNPILQVATYDSPIRYANLLRNGSVIAASSPQDRGASIMDRIRTGTFHPQDPDIVQIIDPIIVDRQRFAGLQIGVSVSPIRHMVRRAMMINAIVVGLATILSMAALLLIRQRYAMRFKNIADAVHQLREGGMAQIESSDLSLRPVAQSFQLLSRELAEKEALLTTTQQDASGVPTAYDPHVTQDLIARFEQMEVENEDFQGLRRTEAIGHSPAWLRCLRQATIRARDKDPVLILGPSGAGKTCIARIIHALSPRRSYPLGELNCAELASADPLIVLGKLFGYGRHSGISGIDPQGQVGILEEYHQGSLFLDEVGILPMQAQQLLLLPLEGRAFNPAAGRGSPKPVDLRFIFATNESLGELVAKGRMRHDLLRRIQGRGVVHVPPLAQRPEDIEQLAQHFLTELNSRQGTQCRFLPDTLNLLNHYSYSEYNVSELRGIIHQSYDQAIFEHEHCIHPTHLPKALQQQGPEASVGSSLFDVEEQRILKVLRQHAFNITRAESELGYAAGAKTLTNRLRGLAYKTMTAVKGDLDAAVSLLIGAREECREKVMAKVRYYMDTLRQYRATHETGRLLINLPQKYHLHLADALKMEWPPTKQA